jgi:hypothetical protein
VVLIQEAQKSGLPYPILRASNPLPNRRLVVIATSPSTHEYGITFDSIVPATPAAAPQIEQEMIDVKPESRGSISTIISSNASIVSIKEEKKGFRLGIFKGVFKSKKPKKLDAPAPPPIETPSVTPSLTRSDSTVKLARRPMTTRPHPRKPESFQFSMESVSSRLENNKGVKERPTPSPKTIEKFSNPGPVILPRFAHELIRTRPVAEHTPPPSSHPRWRYAGRALAEWELIVKQCDMHIDSLFRRREIIPEEITVAEEDGTVYLGQGTAENNSSNDGLGVPLGMEKIMIPRMTVELPRFYFTGKGGRDT